LTAVQMRIVQLLVARVTVGASGLAVDLRHDGIKSLARQMMAPQIEKDAA
jgi:site-specific DNA recombinase